MVIYITKEGTRLVCENDLLVEYYKRRKPKRYRIDEISSIVVFGGIDISSDVLSATLRHHIPVIIISSDGSYFGRLSSTRDINIALNTAQLQKKQDNEFTLQTVRIISSSQIQSMRLMLQRYKKTTTSDTIDNIIETLAKYRKDIEIAHNIKECKNIIQKAEKLYYQEYGKSLTHKGFYMTQRTRRPPRDPVSSMISLVYSLLFAHIHTILLTRGFNTYMAFVNYHDETSEPALVYDIMAEFKHALADTVVREVINRKMISIDDFSKQGEVVLLNEKARDIIISKFQAKLDTKISYAIPDDDGEYTFFALIEKQAERFKQYVLDDTVYKPVSIR